MTYLQTFLEQKNKLPIDYSHPSSFLDFQNKAIQSPLAHSSCEIYFYIHCPTNFENRAIVRIFSQLYLVYGGILYDRLRDELGLVYSMDGYFDKDIDSIVINLNCEQENCPKIVSEIKNVFNDFEGFFKKQKFIDLKESLIKKQMMAKDNPEILSSFLSQTLRMYGKIESYDTFLEKLKAVDEESIRDLAAKIKIEVANAKLVLVSKDKLEV